MDTLILIIFIITYTGIIFTRLPGLNIDRPSAAFFGAIALLITGAISFSEAVAAIEFNTIGLLLGMMMVIGVLELDGFFTLIAQKTLRISRTRVGLLSLITFFTGIASAFLVNDTVVLLFTPVIIRICFSAGLKPMPYLIAEILASNTGSAMSITGNPQNMLIGITSGIDYLRFLLILAPVSLLGMGIIVFVVRWIYKNDFLDVSPITPAIEVETVHYSSIKTSFPIFLLVIVAFSFSSFLNLGYPEIALAGGALILLFGKIKPSLIIKEIDWVLLLFFASLFIVVHAVNQTGFFSGAIDLFRFSDPAGQVISIHGISLLLSQIVSNVPLVILLLPILKSIHSDLIWISLASASTLAGNLTIIGAMANLIVIESAKKHNIEISFFEFLRPGIMVTLLTLLLSVGYLLLLSYWSLI